jgi:hypothetical protein
MEACDVVFDSVVGENLLDLVPGPKQDSSNKENEPKGK